MCRLIPQTDIDKCANYCILLNIFSSLPTILVSTLCTLYKVFYNCTVHCAEYSTIVLYVVQSILQLYCTLCRVFYNCNVHCTGYLTIVLYIVHSILQLYCTLCRVFYNCTVHCAEYFTIVLYIMQSILQLYCTLYRVFYNCTVHCSKTKMRIYTLMAIQILNKKCFSYSIFKICVCILAFPSLDFRIKVYVKKR